MTFTNIKSALNYVAIPQTDVSIPEQVEWASQALGLIDVKSNYEAQLAVLEVEDYVVHLPKDLKHIQAVLYSVLCPNDMVDGITSTTESTSTTTSTTSSTEAIPANADTTIVTARESVDGDTFDTVTTTTTTTIPSQFTLNYNENSLTNVKAQAVLNNYTDINAFLNNTTKGFLLLKLEKSPLAASIHSDCVPNLTSACHYKYTVDSRNRLVCDIKDGYITIFYLARAKDEAGDILIPDDENLKMALGAYVHMRYQQMQMNMHVAGSQGLYRDYLFQWQQMAAKVKGNFLLRQLDRDAFTKVATRGFDFATHPRVFDNYNSYSFGSYRGNNT